MNEHLDRIVLRSGAVFWLHRPPLLWIEDSDTEISTAPYERRQDSAAEEDWLK